MCNWPERSDLARFRPGVYVHFTGNLCTADRLVTGDTSNEKRAEVWYRDPDDVPHQRDFGEFALDRVHADGTTCDLLRPDQTVFGSNECGHGRTTARRFQYLGPRYEPWMRSVNPWAGSPADAGGQAAD